MKRKTHLVHGENAYLALKAKRKKKHSPSGNRTPVSRVTGGDTYHYTNEDVEVRVKYNIYIQYVRIPIIY